ncbi:hypothetical protein H7I57_02280 [Mycobacterium pyrenivorans]|nr:hypothetical protein [Mycolicibacterium pyrenivorans]
MIVTIIVSVAAVLLAPAARADDNVTYEVVSESVRAANIEYFDRSERRVVEGAVLPWRVDATVMDAHSPSARGAEIRADWRGYVPASPLPPGIPIGYWLTVRILLNGKVLCQSTLDVGNAACFGNTNFSS